MLFVDKADIAQLLKRTDVRSVERFLEAYPLPVYFGRLYRLSDVELWVENFCERPDAAVGEAVRKLKGRGAS